MAAIIDIAKGGKARFRNSPPAGRDLYGWCQAFVAHSCAEAQGSETGIRWYGSAEEAGWASPKQWSLVNDSNIPVGAIMYWGGVTDGHVGYKVGRKDGRNLVVHTGVRASDWVLDMGNSLRVSHADTMGIPFLGASSKNGVNPIIAGSPWATDAPTSPHERQVGGVPARRRTEPTTKSAIAGDPLEAHEIGEFDGWIRGESIDGNNIWFRGLYSKNWFHSGGFTNTGTTGLADLNPSVPVSPNVRVTNDVANVRSAPSIVSGVVGQYAKDQSVTLRGYATGQTVTADGVTTDLWFKSDLGWVWAGCFDNRALTSLTDMNAAAPEPQPDYEPFKAFHSVVTQVLPAHVNNYQVGNFPAEPTGITLHDFGTDSKHTFSGTLAHFRNGAGEVSSHFVVSGDEIVQMVDLSNRAYHAGPKGNHTIGIEIDPAVGRTDENDPLRLKTIASVKRLLAALAEVKPTATEWHKHPEWTATACGDDIHFEDYMVTIHPEPENPAPEPAPSGLQKLIDLLIELLNKILGKGK